MKKTLTSLVRQLLPAPVLEARQRLVYMSLLETNLHMGVPDATKRLFVTNAARALGYPTFIETGTFRGEMAAHAAGLFREVHTIELAPALAERARQRFAGDARVHTHEGDSATVLARLLGDIRSSCVFWLDAHYSGGETARGDGDTPVLAELEAVRRHPVRPHAVLIDDARVFGTDPAYPALEPVISLLRQIDPGFHIGVSSDILWAAPVPLLEFRWEERDGRMVMPGVGGK